MEDLWNHMFCQTHIVGKRPHGNGGCVCCLHVVKSTSFDMQAPKSSVSPPLFSVCNAKQCRIRPITTLPYPSSTPKLQWIIHQTQLVAVSLRFRNRITSLSYNGAVVSDVAVRSGGLHGRAASLNFIRWGQCWSAVHFGKALRPYLVPTFFRTECIRLVPGVPLRAPPMCRMRTLSTFSATWLYSEGMGVKTVGHRVVSSPPGAVKKTTWLRTGP